MNRLLLTLSALFVSTGCNNVVSKADTHAEEPLNYAKIRKVFFEPYCIRCHGSAGGYSVETLEDAKQFIYSGNPNSPALQLVISGDMPPRGPKPSAQDIELFAKWIEQGAM